MNTHIKLKKNKILISSNIAPMPPLASEFRASLIRLEFHIRNEGFDEFFFLLFFSFIYLFYYEQCPLLSMRNP